MKIYTIKAQDFKIDTLVAGTIISFVKVSEETLRNLIKENPELIDFWGDEIRNNFLKQPTKKRKYFVPKVGEEYWYCYDSGETEKEINSNSKNDINSIKSGNCFATEQDAQNELNRRQAIVRLWNNYDDKYSWDIDWNSTQPKIYINYSHEHYEFRTAIEDGIQTMTELPYFKSAEDRNQFVKDNESDLKLIFNIK